MGSVLIANRENPSVPLQLPQWSDAIWWMGHPDTGWYWEIIEQGYEQRAFPADQPANWAFFPAYPLLVKLLTPVLSLNRSPSALEHLAVGWVLSVTFFSSFSSYCFHYGSFCRLILTTRRYFEAVCCSPFTLLAMGWPPLGPIPLRCSACVSPSIVPEGKAGSGPGYWAQWLQRRERRESCWLRFSHIFTFVPGAMDGTIRKLRCSD